MSYAIVTGIINSALTDWAAGLIPLFLDNVGAGEKPPIPYATSRITFADVSAGDYAGKKRTAIGTAGVIATFPLGSGPGEAARLADTLDQAFPVNRKITVGGIPVEFTAPVEMSQGVEINGRWSVTFFLTFRSAFYQTA